MVTMGQEKMGQKKPGQDICHYLIKSTWNI